MEINLTKTELFNADRQTDRHDRANSRFSSFANAPSNSQHTNHTPRDRTYTTPQQLKYKLVCPCAVLLGRCFYLLKLGLPSDSNRRADKQLPLPTDCVRSAVNARQCRYTKVRVQKMVQTKMS
jgi:hypothetical protein